MPKRFVVVLGIIMMTFMMLFPVYRQVTVAEGNPMLSIDSVEMLHPGDQATVSVRLKNALDGINMIQFAVEYNTEELNLVSANAGGAFDLTGDPVINDQNPGIVYINWEGEETITSDSILLDLVFEPATTDTVNSIVTISTNEECVLANWNVEFTPTFTNGTIHIEKEWAVIRSVAASLDGKIGLYFYLLLPDYVLNDNGAYVEFNGGEGTTTITVKSVQEQNLYKTQIVNGVEETRWLFIYRVVAKEIRDNITLRVFDGNGNVVGLKNYSASKDYTESGFAYSLYRYCNSMLSSDNEKMRQLAAAIIDYGTASQLVFNHHVNGLTKNDLSSELKAVTSDQLQQYKSVVDGSFPAGITGRSMAVLLESDNSFRVTYRYSDGTDPSDYDYTIDGEVTEQISNGSNSAYIEKTDIAAKLLDQSHVCKVTKDGTAYQMTVSVLTYARSCLSSTDENLQNIGKALYRYNLCAKEYFGNNNNQ